MSPAVAPFLVVNTPRSSALAADLYEEAQIFHAMQSAIARQNQDWAERLLDRGSDHGIAAVIRSVWLPLATELSRHDSAFDPDDHLGHQLRLQIRTALLAESEVPVQCWLVPMKLVDSSATHLAALILTRRGMGARVWPWWPMPAPGPCLMVGDGYGIPPDHDRITLMESVRGYPTLASLAE